MHEPIRLRFVANFTLLLVTFVWGATFSLTKAALLHVGVFSFLTVRFFIAAILLVLLCIFIPKVRRGFDRRTLRNGMILGVLLYGGYALQTLGLLSTTPGTAGFLTGLNVVIVPLLAFPILKSRPTRRNWVGAVVAVIGLAMLTGVRVSSWNVGELLVLGCSVFIALQIVATERLATGQNALALTTVEIVVLTVLCGATLLILPEQGTTVTTWVTPSVLWAVLVCAVLGTAFAYAAQTFFQQSTSSTETAIIFSMEPVFAALLGWLSFHDVLSPLAAVGCALIFASMMVADNGIRFRRRPRRG